MTKSTAMTTEGQLNYSGYTSSPEQSEDSIGMPAPEGLIQQFDELEPRETWADRVEDLLTKLKPREAEYLRMYVAADCSCEPLVDKVGISARGIRFVIASAKENMKRLLRQDC